MPTDRTDAYLKYLVHTGAFDRWGPGWETPERTERIQLEMDTIVGAGFSAYFVVLASILNFCRQKNIPYGPGRGSVGGCLVAYLIGIIEVDALEHGLLFERFMNPERVSHPDVDIDVSQEKRHLVLEYIRDTYQQRGNVVLQVAAFSRAGVRSLVDHMVAAKREEQEDADRIGWLLKDCLPEGNVTGGAKVPYELDFYLRKGHGNREQFAKIAQQAGWLDTMKKLDSMYTNLAKHAAGVVILSPEDLPWIPQAGAKDSKSGDWNMVTAYDMYDLDSLGALKIDLLGLRTLDVIAEAHKFIGGSGATRDLMALWREHQNDPETYALLSGADTLGVFQMETDGYRRTLRQFQPTRFKHLVQLNALYRPGALDYKRDLDGKNMVEVFIDRHHNHEPPTPPHPKLRSILNETHGVILYQEQAMSIAREIAGFSKGTADELRKAIGKKREKEMALLKPRFLEGCQQHGVADAEPIWENIAAAARYSWNKSHAVEYAIITFLTAWFKTHYPAAFYAALLNSYEEDKPKMAHAISEARQKVPVRPPDINVARSGFVLDEDAVVFGLNGVKGLGDSFRSMILADRLINGPYDDFTSFCQRLPSLPIDKKLALVRAGAFDRSDSRDYLLATCDKAGKSEKRWTVAEHVNHNSKLKKVRPLPPPWECAFPSSRDLADGEVAVIGFYISDEPLAEVSKALARVPKGNHHGGEIEKLYRKMQKDGKPYLSLTLLTPALARQRVLVFNSVLEKFKWLEQGDRVLIRGRLDGDTVIADAFFKPEDVRHFRKLQASKNDESSVENFDGQIETVRDLEAAGYVVTLY